MTERKKGKLNKVMDYLKHEDPFAKGVAFCPGCSLELLLRFIPQVLGNDIIITGTPSCSAPALLGQNMYGPCPILQKSRYQEYSGLFQRGWDSRGYRIRQPLRRCREKRTLYLHLL